MTMMKKKVLILVICMALAGCVKAKTADDYYQSGVKYLDAGSYQEAIESFQKAIKIDPKAVQSYTQLALAYQNDGDTEGYINTLQQQIENIPDSDGQVFTDLADAYLAKDQMDQYLSFLQKEYNITEDEDLKKKIDLYSRITTFFNPDVIQTKLDASGIFLHCTLDNDNTWVCPGPDGVMTTNSNVFSREPDYVIFDDSEYFQIIHFPVNHGTADFAIHIGTSYEDKEGVGFSTGGLLTNNNINIILHDNKNYELQIYANERTESVMFNNGLLSHTTGESVLKNPGYQIISKDQLETLIGITNTYLEPCGLSMADFIDMNSLYFYALEYTGE